MQYGSTNTLAAWRFGFRFALCCWILLLGTQPGVARDTLESRCRSYDGAAAEVSATSISFCKPKLAEVCPTAVDSRRLKLTEDVHTYCTKNGPKTRRTMKPKQFRGVPFLAAACRPAACEVARFVKNRRWHFCAGVHRT